MSKGFCSTDMDVGHLAGGWTVLILEV